MDSACSEYDEKAPPRQIPGLEVKGIQKPSQAAIEQWRKERTTKLSLVGCLLFITMVTLIVVALMQQKPILHDYVRYEMEDLQCGREGDVAYYYERIESSNKWLIYLESSTEVGTDLPGGGLCVSEIEDNEEGWYDNCETLADKRPEDIESFDGILSTDVRNELFSTWNTVVVPWCSGFAFTSNMVSKRNKDFSVRGGALLDLVLEKIDFSAAEKVVLAGSGTGGLQALYRASSIKDKINNNDTEVFVVADSAFFVDNQSEGIRLEDLYHDESEEFLPSVCIANNAEDPGRCFWPEVALVPERPEIPIFIIQSWYDSWSLKHLLKINCFKSHTFTYLPNTCRDSDIKDAHTLKTRMENAIGEVFFDDKSVRVGVGTASPLNANLGYWLTTCPGHGFLTHDDSYLEDHIWTVDHKSLQNTLKEWINGVNGTGDGSHYRLADQTTWDDSIEDCPTR